MAADTRDRSDFINAVNWSPDRSHIKYIETYCYDGVNEVSTDNYREGDLRDDQVYDWLNNSDYEYSNRAQRGNFNGGIRLLICERLGFKPLGFAMSRSSFIAIEEAFGLPDETLTVLNSNTGEHSASFNYSLYQAEAPDSVVIMLKVPQMFQLGNFGLVLSHSFETGITSAFLHGWNVLTDLNAVSRTKMDSHFTRISKMIRSQVLLWTHPLLLPVILLKEHLNRADLFKEHVLLQKTTGLEHSLGVTHSGRLTKNRPVPAFKYKRLMEDEEARIQFTTTINTTLTDVISFIGVLRWDSRLHKFLYKTCDRLEEVHRKDSRQSGRKLKEWLDTLDCGIASEAEHAETLKAKLELQLSVLYNFVAQSDSSLNYRLAAQTGLDSAAMKTLAFVTTLFLPPTFIATLFSMSMFNWQGSSGSDTNDSMVVSTFWIYWAVSVPLTLVVLGGWRVWWYHQVKYYMRRYPQVQESEQFNEVPYMKAA